MSLATTYEGKVRMVDDLYSKMSPDERKLMLKKFIKDDMKMFFETIWEEQRFLEKESGIEEAELLESTDCRDTSIKSWELHEISEVGKVSKEAENAYYLDKKRAEKLGNDKYDGFLGYVSDKKSEKNDIPEENNEE